MKAELRQEIIEAVRVAMGDAHKEWVKGDELCARFQMFSPEWLKRYGHSLPRTRASVMDEQGIVHETGWAYPVHEIVKLIETGEIKNLRCMAMRKMGMSNGTIRVATR